MGTQLVGIAAVVLAFATLVLGRRGVRRLRRMVVAGAERVRALRPTPPRPPGRPIEEIARDACRLGHTFRYLPQRISFARFEGCRRAYDVVLAEACRALDVDHLLAVLPPGPELDLERQRVETKLGFAGLSIDDAA
jgi:hypothetical protein